LKNYLSVHCKAFLHQPIMKGPKAYYNHYRSGYWLSVIISLLLALHRLFVYIAIDP